MSTPVPAHSTWLDWPSWVWATTVSDGAWPLDEGHRGLSGAPTSASFLAISAAERVVPATCSYSRTRGVVPTLGIPAHQAPDVARRQDLEGPYFRGLLVR